MHFHGIKRGFLQDKYWGVSGQVPPHFTLHLMYSCKQDHDFQFGRSFGLWIGGSMLSTISLCHAYKTVMLKHFQVPIIKSWIFITLPDCDITTSLTFLYVITLLSCLQCSDWHWIQINFSICSSALSVPLCFTSIHPASALWTFSLHFAAASSPGLQVCFDRKLHHTD